MHVRQGHLSDQVQGGVLLAQRARNPAMDTEDGLVDRGGEREGVEEVVDALPYLWGFGARGSGLGVMG